MNLTSTTLGDFEERLMRLADLFRELPAGETVATRIAHRMLDFVESDMRKLVSGSYVVAAPRQALMILNLLFDEPSLSAVDVFSSVADETSDLRRLREYFHELTQQGLSSTGRGIQARYLFAVDDWLRFGMKTDAFNFSKRLASSGTEVRVIDRSDLQARLNEQLEEDFAILTFGSSMTCAVRIQPEQPLKEFPVMAVLMPSATADVGRRQEIFESLWTYRDSFRLEAV